MTDTSFTPGTRGHTRSTWRDPTHLRGMLMKLIRLNPDADRSELEALYLLEAKGASFHASTQNEAFIDESLRRSFDNDYAKTLEPTARRRPIGQAEIDAVAARVRTMVLLDLVMPNGKLLRHCTGDECGGFSGWFAKIRDRVGSNIVGEVLGEQDLVSLRDAA